MLLQRERVDGLHDRVGVAVPFQAGMVAGVHIAEALAVVEVDLAVLDILLSEIDNAIQEDAFHSVSQRVKLLALLLLLFFEILDGFRQFFDLVHFLFLPVFFLSFALGPPFQALTDKVEQGETSRAENECERALPHVAHGLPPRIVARVARSAIPLTGRLFLRWNALTAAAVLFP